MTKIERLKLRFASGMSEGRISKDDWLHEFLPMLEDAERYRWLRDKRTTYGLSAQFDDVGQQVFYLRLPGYGAMASDVDSAIDAARTPTKE